MGGWGGEKGNSLTEVLEAFERWAIQPLWNCKAPAPGAGPVPAAGAAEQAPMAPVLPNRVAQETGDEEEGLAE